MKVIVAHTSAATRPLAVEVLADEGTGLVVCWPAGKAAGEVLAAVAGGLDDEETAAVAAALGLEGGGRR